MVNSGPAISRPDPVAAGAALLAEVRDGVERRLDARAGRLAARLGAPDGPAIAYALGTPGKRVRAALTVGAYRATGGTGPGILELAAAIEIIHAYSLVHDDLPCMDDDDLRRGRPTTHRAFDVPTATRVGFRLVPAAAEALADAARELGLADRTLGRVAGELFRAGGVSGMVGGQWLDLEAEGAPPGPEGLAAIHRAKTGALIRAACLAGGLAAGGSVEWLAALGGYGDDVGLAFQIADDVLDATRTSEELGKTAGKDRAALKSTYVRLLGVAEARREAERLIERATGRLEASGARAAPLRGLARYIVSRTS